MATNLTSGTFSGTYKDDFKDSDNYHRILFNSGRALQARELTQMQTIIQKEIERLGRYFFKEGSIITSSLGGLASGSYAPHFIKLDETTNALPTTYENLVGKIVENQLATPIKGRIKKVIPAENSDPATLIVEFVDGGQNNQSVDTNVAKIFEPGERLTVDGTNLDIQSTNTDANPAIGRASMVTVPESTFFAVGHFVFVESQTVIIEKYSDTPNATLGFTISEQIVTTGDSIALYDNAGANPNLTSPGADRYRIRLTLKKKSDVSSETFFPLIEVKKGIPVAIQTGDNTLARLGDIVAQRTYDESGNYVVNNKQQFQLQVQQDSDNDYLIYRVQPGVGYVKGRRVEEPITTNDIRVKKPRDATTDTRSVTGENVAARYSNYFLTTSLKGLIGDVVGYIDNVDSDGKEIKLWNGINIGGPSNANATEIGTAFIKNIDQVGSDFRVHVFDIKMDSSGGTPYNLRDVRSIGYDSDNFANVQVNGTDGSPIGQDENALIFPLPNDRPNSLETISMTVQEIFTDTTDGSGTFSVTTSRAADEFADEDQWILMTDSSGEITTDFTINSGGAGSTNVEITGLHTNSSMKLLSYVNITLNPKVKTLTTGHSESVSVTNNKFTLSKHDIYKFNSVIDSDTNENITYKFRLDGGQRDNFYDFGSGTKRQGYSVPSTVRVNYDYFARSGSGHGYTVNSYQNIEYADIPTYRLKSNPDVVYRMTDVIDLRYDKDTSGGFSKTNGNIFRIPRNRDIITIGTAKYYLPRTDRVYLDTRGVQHAVGVSSTVNKAPELPVGALSLHEIELNPYTINEKDTTVRSTNNRGYKMADIRRLNNRITNLEELATLTLSEVNTNNITVTDEDGLERTKIGLTADGFRDRTFTAFPENIWDVKTAIEPYENALMPRVLKRNVQFTYDSDESFARNGGKGVKKYGNTIWPAFEEEVYINQNLASGPENVNQFSLPRYEGSIELVPDADAYVQIRTVDDGTTTTVVKEGELSVHDIFKEY